MVRYHNFDIVFAEIPDETTLAINITNCPNRCPGCHSPHLQRDGGERLDAEALQGLLDRYGRSVTCVCFMGGDAAPHEIARLAETVRRSCPALRTAWYSGRERLPEGFDLTRFDYVKLGPLDRGARSADRPDDQPAALPDRTGRHDERHHGPLPPQQVSLPPQERNAPVRVRTGAFCRSSRTWAERAQVRPYRRPCGQR